MFSGEKVVNNWTRFVLIIWIFVVLIISQSYTASLASMLTVKRLQPTFVDVTEIRKNGYFVGYEKNSFVKDFLVKQLNFNDTKLREYSTPEEYHDALSSGTHNGGVAAIFAGIPYIKLFLAKYCSKFQVVGPTYRTDGFGFVSLTLPVCLSHCNPSAYFQGIFVWPSLASSLSIELNCSILASDL